MNYLLDTNIVSEISKQGRCHPGVQRWYSATDSGAFRISVISLGELRKGVELRRKRDLEACLKIERWLHYLERSFEGKIYEVNSNIAHRWGWLNSIRPLPDSDSLLAATALEYDLTMVTRNTKDFGGTGVRLLDPFEL